MELKYRNDSKKGGDAKISESLSSGVADIRVWFCNVKYNRGIQMSLSNNADRPSKVNRAVALLALSSVISLIVVFAKISSINPTNEAESALVTYGSGFVAIVGLMSIVFYGIFIYLIWQGHNWARITLLVLFLIGVLFYSVPLIFSFALMPVLAFANLVQLVMQVIAFILLFNRESSDWFHNINQNGSRNSGSNETLNIGFAKTKKCPYCAEQIKNEAVFCRHCHKDIPGKLDYSGSIQGLKKPGISSACNYCSSCNRLEDNFDLGKCSVCGSSLTTIE